MGDLRDQLKKAGLLGKKDLKRLAHEERVKRKKEGRDAAEREKAKAREAFRKKQEEKAARDRALQEKRNQVLRKKEEVARLKALVESRKVVDRGRERKFFFVDRAGWVPYLEMGQETARLLEAGNLGIVELPWERQGVFALVPREVAHQIKVLDPECVLFLAGERR